MLNRILHYIRCETYFDMGQCTEMKHNATAYRDSYGYYI